MVRMERLELSRLAALEPKSSASTNSATPASVMALKRGELYIDRRQGRRKTHRFEGRSRLWGHQFARLKTR